MLSTLTFGHFGESVDKLFDEKILIRVQRLIINTEKNKD